MSAENGNRYAEKWTYESTMRALDRINFFAMQEETLYLGMALARAGYYDDIWRYWRKKWARNYEIMHEMKQLSQHFEARLFMRTATGKLPVSLGMFALRHHYGWGREQQAQDDLGYLAEEDANSDLTQTLSKGEGLNASSHLTQTLSKGEGSAAGTMLVVEEEPAADSADKNMAVAAGQTIHEVRVLTPDELLLEEAGISDIREIERRLREEDPELAEFDDMDEDMEWEVVTPETYRR